MQVHKHGFLDNNEGGDEYTYKQNNNDNNLCYSLILIMNIVVLSLIAIFTVLHSSVLHTNTTVASNLDPVIPPLRPDVNGELEELFSILLSDTRYKHANITDNEETLLSIIFDAYDLDDDKRWTLQEFQMFMEDVLDEKTTFHEIDVNGDGILSFREAVVWLTHIHYIPMMKEHFKRQMEQPIKEMFDYSYDTDRDDNNEVDQIWFEYAAQFLFWDYDPDQNGYITFDEWIYHQTSDVWFLFDLNGDQEILFDEFVSGFIAKGFMDKSKQQEIHAILDFKQIVPFVDATEVHSIVLLTNMNDIYRRVADDRGIARRLSMQSYSSVAAAIAVASAVVVAGTVACATVPAACVVLVAGVDTVVATTGTMAEGGGVVDNLGVGDVAQTAAVDNLGAIAAIVRERAVAERATGIAAKALVVGEIAAKGADSCLGENNIVFSSNHGYVLVKDLMLGDHVLSGTDQYSKVWKIDEHNHAEHPSEVLTRLWFNDNDFITLTPDHLVYTTDDDMSYLMRAAEFYVGGELIAFQNQNNDTHTHVIKIDHVLEKTRNPVTMSGDIVVNDILVSSYSYSVQNAQRLHHCGSIFRWISDNINVQIAAIMAHFGQNVVFKTFQFFGLETVFDQYYTVPILFVSVGMFVMLFVSSLIRYIKNHKY